MHVKWFDQLVADIKSLKIQGAENIARAAVKGLARYLKETKKAVPKKFVNQLLKTRSTEPMMQNAIEYFLKHAEPKNADKILAHLLTQFDRADKRIADFASHLIKNKGTYFTHCHSSTVVHAFLTAKKQGKRFEVHNTETRPRFQGRQTAKDLAKAGIPVVHMVDSAARVAVKNCKAVLIGADALLSDGKIVNKIGSEVIAELAHERDIPVYVLASSWKYAHADAAHYKKHLEIRSSDEVWDKAPKNVTVLNNAFEFLNPSFVTAVITEQGIRDPRTLGRELASRR